MREIVGLDRLLSIALKNQVKEHSNRSFESWDSLFIETFSPLQYSPNSC